jgi:hypothetical protein
MPKRFSFKDQVLTFVLAVLASLAAAFLKDIVIHVNIEVPDPESQRNTILDFWLVHKPYINMAITGATILIYAILAYSLVGRIRVAFIAWCIAWFIQLAGVFMRNSVESFASSGIQFHTFFNAMSTSILLLGALIIRRRRNGFFVLLIIPLLGAVVDVQTRSVFLTFVNFAVLTYFSLVILDHFRAIDWVPAYFTYWCYSLYASAQLLYILERHFEYSSGNPQALAMVEVLGYSVGALAKGGGALGMLIVVISFIKARKAAHS